MAVWHAYAAGTYSDESVEIQPGKTFVGGYQITDCNGAVTFKTIVPGWYRGRTIHIHVMIGTLCSSGSVLTEFTTQPFFRADAGHALTTLVSPYSSRSLPDATSAEDGIYSGSTPAYQRQRWRRFCCIHN